jgi:hypothetical protein
MTYSLSSPEGSGAFSMALMLTLAFRFCSADSCCPGVVKTLFVMFGMVDILAIFCYSLSTRQEEIMDTTSIASSRTEDTPKGVNILQMAEFKQADRLRKIAETARARTLAQRYAYQNLKKAEEMAEEGITEFKDRIMTLEFFKANKQAIKVPPGVDQDDYVETLYKAQKESYKLMEDEGFKVTYEELDLPSTLDINMDAQTRRMVEETKRFTESTVTVSWE